MSLDVMVAEPVPTAPGLMGISGCNGTSSTCLSSIIPLHPNADVISIDMNELPAPLGLQAQSSATIRDYFELTKPRIVLMILVTTVVAAVVAAGSSVSPWTMLHLLFGVAMVAGSAGAMNQVWEHEIDKKMERTRRRPISAGRVSVQVGFTYAMFLGVAGTVYLGWAVGVVPALVGVATWIAYVPLYTPLKTRSPWNTTVGAVSGALPVLIGYTAAGGGLSDLRGWLLFGVLAAWQYPHFMAIAWLYRRQYAEAGFQMTTTVEPTGKSAGRQSVVGMIVLIACLTGLVLTSPHDAVAPGSLTFGTLFCLIGLAAASYPMSKAAWRFSLCRDDLTARKLLRASLLQLPLSLALVTAAAVFASK